MTQEEKLERWEFLKELFEASYLTEEESVEYEELSWWLGY